MFFYYIVQLTVSTYICPNTEMKLKVPTAVFLEERTKRSKKTVSRSPFLVMHKLLNNYKHTKKKKILFFGSYRGIKSRNYSTASSEIGSPVPPLYYNMHPKEEMLLFRNITITPFNGLQL